MISADPAENSTVIDYHNVKKAAIILRALNNNLRQLILQVIYENKEITVTEIYVKLRMEQAVASQHLAILRRAGLVVTKRDGKRIFYSINFVRLQKIDSFIKELLAK